MGKIASLMRGLERGTRSYPQLAIQMQQQRRAKESEERSYETQAAAKALALALSSKDPEAIRVAWDGAIESGVIPPPSSTLPGIAGGGALEGISPEVDPRTIIGEGTVVEAQGEAVEDPRLKAVLEASISDRERQQKTALEEEQKRQMELRQAEIDYQQSLKDFTKWNKSKNGKFYWRQTGDDIEYFGAPPSFTDRTIRHVDLDRNILLDSDGEMVPLSKALKTAISKGIGGKKVHSVSIDTGVVVYSDGTEGVLSEEAMARVLKRQESRKADAMEMTAERYAHSQALVEYRAASSLELRGKIRLADARKYVTAGLQSGDLTPRQAATYVRGQVQEFVNESKLDLIAAEVEEDFAQFAMKVPLSGADKKELAQDVYAQHSAEDIIQLLKKPQVRENLHWFKGRVHDLDAAIFGEKGLPPEYIEFMSLLEHVRDVAVVRSRTGAAVNESERTFYKQLLGSSITDPDALMVRMKSFIHHLDNHRNALWTVALDTKYVDEPEGTPPELYDRIPQYQLRYRSAAETGLTDDDFR